jgi:hypothetical protein
MEIEEFLKCFCPSFFTDFSFFEFEIDNESFIEPFPRKISGEWRYIIHLSHLEVEDLVVITHEITECTIGRLIEKLLCLDKPLYLKRKEENNFWVHGKHQKYLLEHVVATLSEIGHVENEKLKERFAKEDFNEIMKKFS